MPELRGHRRWSGGQELHEPDLHRPGGQLQRQDDPQPFISHFAFQCGYCTAGFLNEAQVLLERLERQPVPRRDLEATIAEALDGHLCRCTGYIRYHQAVRAVVLADPARYLAE